ncbi:MAG: UDP-galactopyranose mutase [Fermentimonas sp.]|nr:UDP-galactopyranose mutase [Dysgonamonadaceae bacterium]MDD4697748.1 UDP-galactopyranose mutase [Fermentimonas sp.]
MDKYDVIIIGAGFTGLIINDILRNTGKRVLVLEKDSQPGGLLKTINFSNQELELGPHFFFYDCNNNIIADYLTKRFDLIPIPYLKARAYYNKDKTDSVTWPLCHSELEMIEKSLESNLTNYKGLDSAGFENIIIKLVGHKYYQVFFQNYTKAFWGVEPKDISTEWAPKKIRITQVEENFFKPNENVLIPQSGYKNIIDTLLDRCDVKNERVISVTDNIVRTKKRREYRGEHIISTVSPDSLLQTENQLKNRALILIYFQTQENLWDDDNVGFVYISNPKPFTRITNLSYIWKRTDKNYPNNFYCVEWPTEISSEVVYDKTAQRDILVDHLNSFWNINKIINFKPVLVEDAYPLPTFENLQVAEHLKNELKKTNTNIHFAGRFGKYQFSWMRDSIQDAFEIYTKIIES